MQHLKDFRVLVLGLGETGLGLARWCTAQGAQVTVWDSREVPPHAATLREACPQAVLVGGPLETSILDGVQLVLKSPGLGPDDARIAGLLAAARARAVAVQGELDLFVRALADLKAERGYAPKLVAITGTNGKTTTTSLATLLIERCGLHVVAAGNIGPTLLDTLAQALEDEASLPEVWVMELSSFQLHDLHPATSFEPDAAVVLNLTQDHLDWHGSFEAYAAAKARIFGERTRRVINRDDARVEALAAPPVIPTVAGKPAKSAKPAKPATLRGAKAVPMVRFGVDAPRTPGDFGLVVENGMAWLVRAVDDDAPAPRRRAAADDAAPEVVHLQRLMPADALRIRGRHNAANALAALALAVSIGCPLAPMLHGLREYEGEPHRVAFVARVGEVEAFDDSKGTNVGATVAALLGLGAEKAPGRLAVILGGDGKGQDFAPLAEPLARHGRAAALIGRDAAAIESALAPAAAAGLRVERHATLEAATGWCFEQARAGDAVLLSPACASLDMFRNYAHRAEVFVAAVHARAAERGEAVA